MPGGRNGGRASPPPAFVLCDWFREANDRPPPGEAVQQELRADVDDWDADPEGVAYDPSEDVKWLASEFALLDPSLSAPDAERPPA